MHARNPASAASCSARSRSSARRSSNALMPWLLAYVESFGRKPDFGSGLAAGCTGLVILGVLVHGPDIVVHLAGDDVARRQQRGHHRVILVVVFVHAVAADEMKVGTIRGQRLPNHI